MPFGISSELFLCPENIATTLTSKDWCLACTGAAQLICSERSPRDDFTVNGPVPLRCRDNFFRAFPRVAKSVQT
jgi:hypothetical protein